MTSAARQRGRRSASIDAESATGHTRNCTPVVDVRLSCQAVSIKSIKLGRAGFDAGLSRQFLLPRSS